MKQDSFYKTSCHGGVGMNVCFHAINGNGYTTNLDEAHIYSRNTAQAEVNKGWIREYPEQELFLSANHVESLSQWRVDSQYIDKRYPEFQDKNGEYVSVKANCWDGNDLAFGTGMDWDFDYGQAKVFSVDDIKPYVDAGNKNMYFVPKSHTDEIARRTFQKQNINRRTMISGAGIVGLKKPIVRKTTGKNRFNCSCCGKIIWEFAHPDTELKCNECKINRSFRSPIIGCY